MSLVFLITVSAIVSWCNAGATQADGGTNCSNNFFLMEQSLLENTDNRFNLLKAFYPPTEAHPVLVRVNYTFTTAVSEYWNESQVWYWTESEFYLIQPLEVFQFTSLLFSNMPYRRKDLSITLNTDCTQAPSEYFLLLTQRLQLYAQSPTTGPQAPTQRVSSSYTAVAVSITDVQKDTIQSTFVKVWLHLILVIFPVLSWLLLYLCDPVQLLLGDKTWTKLEDEQTHGTLAAMIQISVVFTTFVLVLDILGIYYTVSNDSNDVIMTTQHTAFYLSTVTGIIVDVGAFVWVVIVVINIFLQSSLQKLLNQHEQTESSRVKIMFSSVTISPVLCLANHLHYIMIAFMSDPYHAGSIAITYVMSFFLFFLIFRQFYNRVVLQSNKRPKIVTRMKLCQKCSAKEKLWNPLSRKSSTDTFDSKHSNEVHKQEVKCNCFIPGPNCHAPFNTHVVVIGIVVVGPLLVLYEAIIIALFLTLPVTKSIEDGPSRLYTIYQGTGLLIVALLTYNILLNPTPFSIARTIERLAKRLRLPENTNFWNRLSIEEKLAKVLVTLLETHFQNIGATPSTGTTPTKKSTDDKNNSTGIIHSAAVDGAIPDEISLLETEI